MALEKPVIATNAGGNDELITSSDVGWLIPMRDHDALVRAIEEVITNPQRSAEVGRNARRHVVKGYSKELRIDRLEELYSSILRAKGAEEGR
jgi:glycosyltransferase involved in cell wall biosynthesis